MAKSDTRRTVLDIVNRVQERLGLDSTTTLIQDKQVKTLLQLLNETIDDISDSGDWVEMYQEVTAVAVSGQSVYGLGVAYPIKNIYEISFDTRPQSLYNVEIETLNRYIRSGGSSGGMGEPRHFAIKSIDGKGNPQIQVYPKPGASEDSKNIVFAIYRKPRLLDFNSLADELEFPGDLIVQGLYARALLEENGGFATDQSKYAWAEYEKMKKESLNRFNGDTSTTIQFYPSRK